MRKPLLAALIAALTLGACGQSRLNPLNWFGHSKRTAVATVPVDPKTGVPLAQPDPRPQVAEVTSLSVERTPGGAIVHATGLPPTQGWWNAELVPENDGKPVKGVLSYRFVIVPPPGATAVSTPQSREVTVAVRLTDYQLQGVHAITVAGSADARTVRR